MRGEEKWCCFGPNLSHLGGAANFVNRSEVFDLCIYAALPTSAIMHIYYTYVCVLSQTIAHTHTSCMLCLRTRLPSLTGWQPCVFACVIYIKCIKLLRETFTFCLLYTCEAGGFTCSPTISAHIYTIYLCVYVPMCIYINTIVDLLVNGK